MKTSAEFKNKPSVALLLIGDPKAGKSRLASAFPAPYFLDLDLNLQAVNTALGGKKPFFYDDPYTDAKGNPIPSVTQENLRNLTLKSTQWARAQELLREAVASPAVRTIIVDSTTTLSEILVDHLMLSAWLNEGKALDRMRIQDYQPFGKLFTSLVMGLRNTGKNIVFTTHIKSDKDEATGRLSYEFRMPGQLSRSFGSLFNDVWACTAENIGGNIKYSVHFKPTGLFTLLGTTYAFERSLDITNKTPIELWPLLNDKFSFPA